MTVFFRKRKIEVITRILGYDTPPELAVFRQCKTWDGAAIERRVVTSNTHRVIADEQVGFLSIATRDTQPSKLELEMPIRRLTVESRTDARMYATSPLALAHGDNL